MEYVSRRAAFVLPPPGQIIPNNYVVLKERLERDKYTLDFRYSEGDLLGNLDSLRNESFFRLMYRLDSLADKEREKEIAFLSMIVSSPIFRKNFGHRVKELEDKLLHAIKTEKSDLGSLFTLINVAEQEINNIIDRKEWDNYRGRSIATRITDIVIEKISEIVDKSSKELNHLAISSVEDALNGVDLDMNQIFEEAVLRAVGKEKNAVSKRELTSITNEMLKRTGFQKWMSEEQFSSFIDTGKLNLLQALNAKKSDEGVVKQSLRNLFKYLYWGLGGEASVDLSGGSSYSANRRHMGYQLNKRNKQGLTDVIELFNITGSLEMTETMLGEIFGSDGIERQIKEIASTIRKFSDNLTIHYSVKDYRFLNKTGMSDKDFAIQSGNLFTRFDKKGGVTDADLDSLLFMVNNAADGGMYSADGDREDVLAAVASVAVKWMFDDYAEQTALPINTANSLHVFVINGLYYPISSILRKFSDQLAIAETSDSIIMATGTWPDAISQYDNVIKPSIPFVQGDYSRWDNLAAFSKKNTSVRIKLNKVFFNVAGLGNLE